MTIRNLLYTFLFATLVLASAIAALTIKLRSNEALVIEAQERRLSTYKLADELRQSSDDLTRFARTYAATGDQRFERYFWQTLDIRNGTSERPVGYGGIFWDLVIANMLPEPPAEEAGASSLEDRMIAAGITSAEFAKLKEAQDRSDELVNLEETAMNAVRGRFDNGSGSFTRVAAPDQAMAIALLHGDRYHAAKAQIMEPIGEFLNMLDSRTEAELISLNQQSRQLLTAALATSLALFGCVVVMVWTLQSRLVRRSTLLLNTVKQIGGGNLAARSKLRGTDEIGILGAAIDAMAGRLSEAISEARRSAQEVSTREREQQTQTELARASRLTTLGTMTASIAHEIRQPLAAIVTGSSAGLRWLARTPPDIDEVRLSLSAIQKDGQRANEIISSVRAMFEKDTQERSPRDINEPIREVLALVRGEFKRNDVTLRTALTDDLPKVRMDRVQVQQVLMNLVANAVEAMRSLPDRPRTLQVRTGVNDGGDIEIAIEDSGPGIDPENLDRIFQPFFTTKSKGTGLGLSICRSIVESHDGRLSVSLVQPHGAVFVVALPHE